MDWPGGSGEATLRIVLTGVISYFIVLWIGVVIWTYRDIRDRTNDTLYQVACVFIVLLFNFPGLMVYLMVRPAETMSQAYQRSLEEEAILRDLSNSSTCPTCHHPIEPDFVICPSCRSQLKEPCTNCGRPLSYGWTACPYCATDRRGRAPAPPTPAAQWQQTYDAPVEASTAKGPASRRGRPSRGPAENEPAMAETPTSGQAESHY